MPHAAANPPSALLLVDVINHFEFEDGDRLLRSAMPIARNLRRLKARAKQAGVPVIYVNDNFGRWRSDMRTLIEYCLRPEAPGRPFVEAIRPDEDDYFVLKPMHSAFYQTPLETLLRLLNTTSLVLCGLATNSCIVCTAHDANMREFQLWVASDSCAAKTRREHVQTIDHLKTMAKARIVTSASIRFGTARGRRPGKHVRMLETF